MTKTSGDVIAKHLADVSAGHRWRDKGEPVPARPQPDVREIPHLADARLVGTGRADEERLVEDMIELTRQFGRYGYRRVAALLIDAGWQVNDKRVERLWRREGLKVPMK